MAQSAIPSPLPLPVFNPTRFRAYVLRLPLFTRIVFLACISFWLLELQTVWSVTQWGSLIPKEIGIQSLYRLNTFPFIHMGFLHMLVNVICLVPLMERFEKEQGTLVSILLFMGRKYYSSGATAWTYLSSYIRRRELINWFAQHWLLSQLDCIFSWIW